MNHASKFLEKVNRFDRVMKKVDKNLMFLAKQCIKLNAEKS